MEQPLSPAFAPEQIRILLKGQHRNLLLLELLLMTSATLPRLAALQAGELKYLAVGDMLPASLRTAKHPWPVFTRTMQKSLQDMVQEKSLADTDLVFQSNKGTASLSITSISRLVRSWLEATGQRQGGGIRELRGLSYAQQEKKEQQAVPVLHELPRIEARTRQEIVFTALEQAIIAGKIPPGEKLSTEKIARQMGVSRIPVREAMGRLEARGFITTRSRKGSVVNELSRAGLKEILSIRLLLECEAVEKAAYLVKEETLEELQQINRLFAVFREKNDADELLRANRKFHFLAYQDAHSPVLLELINQLWDRVSPYYNIMFRQSLTTHPNAGVDYHEQLITALRLRKSQEAKKWLRADLVRSAEFVLELFDLTSNQ